MSVIVNTKGLTHLKGLIRAGKVDRESKWSAPALKDYEGDLKAFGQVHLAIHSDEDKDSSARYGYPVAKDGMIYRSGVVAAKQRAAGQGQDSIAAVADRLWKLIDKKPSKAAAEVATGSQPVFDAAYAYYIQDQVIKDLQGLLDAGLPVQTWVQVAPYGVYHDTRDPKDWAIYADNCSAMIDTFNGDGNDIPADRDHGTAVVGGDHKAYGWCIALADRGLNADGGLWALVEWSADALPLILSGGYRYISGHFMGGAVVGGVWLPSKLRAIALTNTPLLKGMQEILASEAPGQPLTEITEGAGQSSGGAVPEDQTTKGDQTVDELKKLCTKYGIPVEGKSETDLWSALNSHMEKTASERDDLQKQASQPFEEAFLSAIKLPATATPTEVKAKILAEMGGDRLTETAKLASEVSELKAKLASEQVEKKLETLFAGRFITPAERAEGSWVHKLAHENPQTFDAFAKERQAAGPIEKLGSATNHRKPEANLANDAAFSKLASSAGISAEDIKAYEAANPGGAE